MDAEKSCIALSECVISKTRVLETLNLVYITIRHIRKIQEFRFNKHRAAGGGGGVTHPPRGKATRTPRPKLA